MSADDRPSVGAAPTTLTPLRLTPTREGRPWGGGRFGSADGLPVGELWVSGDAATLPDGRTLAGAGIAAGLPLVKLLDVAGTLSVQVHPDDATARALHGPDAVGKHECWVVLEAPPGATVALGLAPGASAEDLFGGDEERIRAALRARPVAVGDVLDIPPGTVHAPAGGLVLYEIQQRSDLTYRIWDWGRPRQLHLDASRRAIRPASEPPGGSLPIDPGCAVVSDAAAPFRLVACRLDDRTGPVELETDRPGLLSVIEGALHLDAGSAGREEASAELERGSHWLLPGGRWRLGGGGLAFVASMRGPGA